MEIKVYELCQRYVCESGKEKSDLICDVLRKFEGRFLTERLDIFEVGGKSSYENLKKLAEKVCSKYRLDDDDQVRTTSDVGYQYSSYSDFCMRRYPVSRDKMEYFLALLYEGNKPFHKKKND